MISSALYLNSRAFDDPWRRLPCTLVAAALISAALLWEFGRLMNKPEPLPEAEPVEAQLVELPPPPPKPEPVKLSKPVAPPTPQPAPQKPQFVVPKETTSAPVPPQEQLPAQPATPPPPSAAPVSRNTNNDTGNMGAQAIDKPLPKIPDDLREQAFSVTAMARFHIAVDGTATVELATPTPNPRLNRLLLDTLKNWKFFPAMKDGKPVASVQDIRVQFEVK